jgi:hypothetical protein
MKVKATCDMKIMNAVRNWFLFFSLKNSSMTAMEIWDRQQKLEGMLWRQLEQT